jgi:hypothetical protein
VGHDLADLDSVDGAVTPKARRQPLLAYKLGRVRDPQLAVACDLAAVRGWALPAGRACEDG